MNRNAGVESKILDYFRTAPVGEAGLMLSIISGEMKQRTAPRSIDISKPASGRRPGGAKRGRPRKITAAPSEPAVTQAADQPGEPVPLEAVLG